jgi:hypothetical protein
MLHALRNTWPSAMLALALTAAPAQPPSEISLPEPVIDTPAAAASIDWAAVRAEAGTDYPSRWDDLTLVDSCLWATPEELAEHLGIGVPIMTRRVDFQCRYYVGNYNVFLHVYVEVHATAETVREAEYNFSEGFGRLQFTAMDPGASDLHVYVSTGSNYLYAFPENGRTQWRIQYLRAGPELEALNGPTDGEVLERIGPRFMQLLVEKYGGQL